MIRYPNGIKAGIRPSQKALSIDLAPTLLDLAGTAPGNEFHGVSLRPLLEGTSADWRSSFLVEYYSDTVFERIFKMGYKAVRTENYKYIQYVNLENMNELYDLAADPYELRNVIRDSGYADIVTKMQIELQRLLDATS